MKKQIIFLFIACLTFFYPLQIVSADENPEALVRSEALLDTFTQITIYPNDANSKQAMDEAFKYIEAMAQLFSEFEEGTDISQINAAAGRDPIKVHPQTLELIEYGLKKSQNFESVFDITIGPISYPWKKAADQNTIPSEATIKESLNLIDYHQVVVNHSDSSIYLKKEKMRLDLGSISKGYIADGVARILKEHQIDKAIINLGGNLVLLGTKPNNAQPWTVGVQNPGHETGSVVGSLPITNKSVVTSGIYERFVEVDGIKYHHLLNPKTGFPIDNTLASVTIITDRSLEADAYATIVFGLGLEEGMHYINQSPDLEAIFITKDQEVYLSQGVKDFKLLDEQYQIFNP
ncbi:FAD:protein FMN transferase [Facklamia miroungae]|uniref:FAD:protein FMN transferase n=1 Tax=Facklamia miroungae TaxID=120956 RepID=A0A1G7QHN2_9LACT|nr:FAD:protein FMN transferase [Facklamia miroungae]NKZ28943.1 FAD:protein FMN transferase [Facklamia miroungae]SDF97968.1 thiamine biosynthesis lipoprotein [Facklamia miroungae]